MNRTRKPVFQRSRRTAPLSLKKTLPVIAVLALATTLATCNLRPISRSLTWYGYMDTTGQMVIPMKFDDALHFSEGLAAVKVGTKWGYIDKNGQVVIEPQFLAARDFKQGRARVEVAPDTWCYVDSTGKVAVRLNFKYGIHARDFSEGFAAVYIEDPNRFECLSSIQQDVREDYDGERGYVSTPFCGRWGFIRQDGTFAVEPQFIEAFDFAEELAAIRVRDPNTNDQRLWRYGYMGRNGAVVIQPQFDAAFDFSEGIARVVVAGRKRFIDKTGKFLTEGNFDDVKDFHEGLAQVKVGDRWGYVDKNGKMVIPPEFKTAGPFSEGLASANRSGNLGGYIDRTGAMVIREQFGVAWPFSDGLARVQIGDGRGIVDRWGYIDRSGKVVISRMLKAGWPFREGLALVGDGGPI